MALQSKKDISDRNRIGHRLRNRKRDLKERYNRNGHLRDQHHRGQRARGSTSYAHRESNHRFAENE